MVVALVVVSLPNKIIIKNIIIEISFEKLKYHNVYNMNIYMLVYVYFVVYSGNIICFVFIIIFITLFRWMNAFFKNNNKNKHIS